MTERNPVPSLGDILLRAGVIDPGSLEKLVTDLRERLRAGRPTSIARLVVEKGVPAARILALVGNVDGPSFRCDACSTPFQTGAYAIGREFPCSRCGALLVGLGRPAAAVDDGRTVRFQGVLRIPDGVPATPAAPKALSESDVAATTLAFQQVLPVPGAVPMTPATAPTVCEEDETGRTMTFKNVLPLPSVPAPVMTPRAPPVDEGNRTILFGNVLALPQGEAPQPMPPPTGAPPAMTPGWLPPPPPPAGLAPAPTVRVPPPVSQPWQPPPLQAAWLPGPPNTAPGFNAPAPIFNTPAPAPLDLAPDIFTPPPRPQSNQANPLPPVPGFGSEAVTIADPEGNDEATLPAQKMAPSKSKEDARPPAKADGSKSKEDVRATASGKAPTRKRGNASGKPKARIGPAAILLLVVLSLLATGGILFALGVFSGSK